MFRAWIGLNYHVGAGWASNKWRGISICHHNIRVRRKANGDHLTEPRETVDRTVGTLPISLSRPKTSTVRMSDVVADRNGLLSMAVSHVEYSQT
jgi:hypothetical protein